MSREKPPRGRADRARVVLALIKQEGSSRPGSLPDFGQGDGLAEPIWAVVKHSQKRRPPGRTAEQPCQRRKAPTLAMGSRSLSSHPDHP